MQATRTASPISMTKLTRKRSADRFGQIRIDAPGPLEHHQFPKWQADRTPAWIGIEHQHHYVENH